MKLSNENLQLHSDPSKNAILNCISDLSVRASELNYAGLSVLLLIVALAASRDSEMEMIQVYNDFFENELSKIYGIPIDKVKSMVLESIAAAIDKNKPEEQ